MLSLRTTAQKPCSSWGNGNSVGGCQLTGASRRRRANVSSRSSNVLPSQNATDEMSTSIVRSCGVDATFMNQPPNRPRGDRTAEPAKASCRARWQGDVEAQPAPAFAIADPFAAADPQRGAAIRRARQLVAAGDDRAVARYLLFGEAQPAATLVHEHAERI